MHALVRQEAAYVVFGESIDRLSRDYVQVGQEARRKYLSEWTLSGLLLLGGDLNPILGFYFPLFSMVFPRELPSGWKIADFSGSKTAANCCKSTYIFCFGYVRLKLKSLVAFLGILERRMQKSEQGLLFHAVIRGR